MDHHIRLALLSEGVTLLDQWEVVIPQVQLGLTDCDEVDVVVSSGTYPTAYAGGVVDQSW